MEVLKVVEALLRERRQRRRDLCELAFQTVVTVTRQRDTIGHLAGGPSPPPAPGLSRVKEVTYVV